MVAELFFQMSEIDLKVKPLLSKNFSAWIVLLLPYFKLTSHYLF